MSYYAAFFIAMCFTLALIPPLLRMAAVWGVVDNPGARKVHKEAIPSIGGIAMILGSLVPFVIWVPFSKEYVSIAAAVTVLFVFGVWDDRNELSYRTKVLGQLIAAVVVVVFGDVIIKWPPFFDVEPLADLYAVPLTIFCLLAITNAMNLADGLDGLAGGATLLSFAFIGILAYQHQEYDLLIVTLSVVGGILGFLRFNSHPAKIFMGDTGSQFLGFILGVQTILLIQSDRNQVSAALPLLILGLPLVDTLSVLLGRLINGKSPFKADKTHIHHRLLAFGFTHYETVVLLYIVQAMFVLTAYFLRFSDDEVIIGVFIGFICFILVGIKQLERSKALFDVNRRTTLIIKLPLRKMRTFINSRWLDTAICSLMLFFVPVYTWYLSSIHARIPSDILLLAIALLSLLGITYLYSWFVSKKNLKLSGLEKVKDKTILNRLSVYTFNALLVYMSHTSLFKPELFTQVEWIFFVCLGFLVFSIILFGTRPRFETTPMDVLVLLVGALMALALPLIQAEDYSLAIIQFIVLLYGFELILHTDHLIFSSILRWVLFISLFTIVIQGLA